MDEAKSRRRPEALKKESSQRPWPRTRSERRRAAIQPARARELSLQFATPQTKARRRARPWASRSPRKFAREEKTPIPGPRWRRRRRRREIGRPLGKTRG